MTSLKECLIDLVGMGVDIYLPEFDPGSDVLKATRLNSKKNRVHHLVLEGGEIVVKVYDHDRWRREQQVLLSCESRGILVPHALQMGEGYTIMEFLGGPDLRDLINHTLRPGYVRLLADWMADFHTAFFEVETTMVRSDAKLQNFILTEVGVAGLDFELAHMGDPLEDLGEVCAHILNTDPMFTPDKESLCNEFLLRYSMLTGFSLTGITEWVIWAMEQSVPFRPHQRGSLEREIDLLRRGQVWPFCDHDQKR
jgi:tRNA A-37 threonylcarbamoyl transferase component Bud32